MNVEDFISLLNEQGVDFFTGVPDSQLKPLCNYLMNTFGWSNRHIIAANEGNAVGLAAGHYLATGKVPCVYLQNSGIGNITNPVASLLNDQVYGIPCIFVVGWRGEPSVHDEPQHLFQGAITLELLEILGISCIVIDDKVTRESLGEDIRACWPLLETGKSIAFVIKKGGLSYSEKVSFSNDNPARREDIIQAIVDVAREDIIVSTTGKTSRELFEVREQKGQSHKYDFLTVGSMGHSSSIALGLSLRLSKRRVWCIDGDGAALMHMGAMATIGALSPANFVHILINNEAHESVGGQPTVAGKVDFCAIARGCGYSSVLEASTLDEFEVILSSIDGVAGPIFVEVKSAIGSRSDLGRPTGTPKENKEAFMRNFGGVTSEGTNSELWNGLQDGQTHIR